MEHFLGWICSLRKQTWLFSQGQILAGNLGNTRFRAQSLASNMTRSLPVAADLEAQAESCLD